MNKTRAAVSDTLTMHSWNIIYIGCFGLMESLVPSKKSHCTGWLPQTLCHAYIYWNVMVSSQGISFKHKCWNSCDQQFHHQTERLDHKCVMWTRLAQISIWCIEMWTYQQRANTNQWHHSKIKLLVFLTEHIRSHDAFLPAAASEEQTLNQDRKSGQAFHLL